METFEGTGQGVVRGTRQEVRVVDQHPAGVCSAPETAEQIWRNARASHSCLEKFQKLPSKAPWQRATRSYGDAHVSRALDSCLMTCHGLLQGLAPGVPSPPPCGANLTWRAPNLCGADPKAICSQRCGRAGPTWSRRLACHRQCLSVVFLSPKAVSLAAQTGCGHVGGEKGGVGSGEGVCSGGLEKVQSSRGPSRLFLGKHHIPASEPRDSSSPHRRRPCTAAPALLQFRWQTQLGPWFCKNLIL